MSKPQPAEINLIEDKERTYWIQVPQLVLARSLSVYDFALWCAIKMVSGDEKECFLSTSQLADLAMMSAGQVTISRRRLIQARLLEGEIRKDPGYPQPVWHLSIPDMWPENHEWREAHQELKGRIELKRAQKEARKSVHQVNAPQEPSPGERGPLPGERGPLPGETKKNQSEIQPRTGDALWKTIKADLKGRMDNGTFQHLDGSELASLDGDQGIVTVKSEYAASWLNGRLKQRIEEIAAGVLGRPVYLTFAPAATAIGA